MTLFCFKSSKADIPPQWIHALPEGRLVFLEWATEEHFGHVSRVRSDVSIDGPSIRRKRPGKSRKSPAPKFFQNGVYPDPSQRAILWTNRLVLESMLPVMSLRSRTALPSLFSTCAESRKIVLQHYELTFGTSVSPPRTYFNFDKDMLVMPGSHFSKGPQEEHWFAHCGKPQPDADRDIERQKLAQWRAPNGLERVQSLCLDAYTDAPMVLTALRDNGIHHPYFGGTTGHGAQSCRQLLTLFPGLRRLNLGALTARKPAWSNSVRIPRMSESEISDWMTTRRLNSNKNYSSLEQALTEQRVEVGDFILALANSCASEHPPRFGISLRNIMMTGGTYFNVPWIYTDDWIVAPRIAAALAQTRRLGALCSVSESQ